MSGQEPGTVPPRRGNDDGGRQKPLLVIQPGSTPVLQYARDVWHHRDLVRVLAIREIKLRYRQTALGATWVFLQPLLSAGVLGFVFGRVAGLPTDGIPFFVFAYAGMLAWNAFNNTVTRATSSLVSNSGLIAKIFFPRLILPLSIVRTNLIDFCVTAVPLALLLVTNDLIPGPTILLLPLWLALMIMLSLGIGTFLGAVAVRYRDVPQAVPLILQLALFASPVAYSLSAIPGKYQGIYYLNPMASLLEAFRWSVFGTALPPTGHLVYSVIVSLTVFAVGLVAMEKMERGFADVI